MRDLLYQNPIVATALTMAEAAVHARRYSNPSAPGATPDGATKKIAEELARDGVAVVPNFFDADTCASLRESIDSALEATPENAWVDPEGADHRLFGFERVAPEAETFFSDASLHQLGCGAAGCDLVNFFTLAGRITAVEGNRGSGGGWHRDSFARQFKAIVYLSDVEEENGPFQFLAGTTRLSAMIRDLWRGGLGFRQTRIAQETVDRLLAVDAAQLRTMTGPAGTLVLADTRGIHRGMPIRQGQRYALTNYYFARPDATEERIAHFGSKVPFADGGSLTRDGVLAFEPREITRTDELELA